MIYGHKKRSPSRNDTCSAIYCTDIVLDDDIVPQGTNKNRPLSADVTECVDDASNRSKTPLLFVEQTPSEIHLIPRNKLNTFKSFRNSTFKLVSSGDSSSSSLVKNSNNSNRFIHTPVNNPVTEESVFINRINKKVMLRKITEIASPFLTLDHKDSAGKEFKRILPHPIIDNNTNQVLTMPNSNKSEVILKQNHSRSNSNKKISNNSINIDYNKSQILSINEEEIDLDDYEKLLEQRLFQVKQMKNKTQETSSLKEGKGFVQNIEVCNAPIKIQDNERSKLNYRAYRDKFKSNIEKELLNCQLNLKKSDALMKSKLQSHLTKSKIHSDPIETWHNNEIEVCLDDKCRFNEREACLNNSHIPLYFQCEKSGKKMRFRTRFMNRMSQSMKAFSARIGNVLSLADLEFVSPNNRIISDKDTPCILSLKPNDIIKIRNKY